MSGKIDRSRMYSIIEKIIDELISTTDLTNTNIESWLRFNALRYLLHRGEGRKRIRYKGKTIDLEKDFKRNILSEICLEAYKCSNSELNKLFEKANKLLDNVKKALEDNKYSVLDFQVETKSKLIVGVSEEMFGKPIFEVGLMWNPYLNLPYIPGSSLKGAFRSYLSLKGIKIEDFEVSDLLGSESHISYIVFTDSYPVGCRDKNKTLLTPEVTTPIYHELEGRILETQAQPVPIVYPVIGEGIRFRIIIGVRKLVQDEKLNKIKSELMKFISDILKQGIGAKTMLGYGTLTVL